MENLQLEKIANEVRKNIVTALHSAGSGHPGGSLSAADMVTYLYYEEMNVDVNDTKNPDRDRFVLSKGHAAPVLYGVLAEKGYIPKEDLIKLRKTDSYLQGHPDMKHTAGVEMSAGSLGQGVSAAASSRVRAAKTVTTRLPACFIALMIGRSGATPTPPPQHTTVPTWLICVACPRGPTTSVSESPGSSAQILRVDTPTC